MSAQSEKAEPATGQAAADTQVGSVFVSNYPPYSAWDEAQVAAAREKLGQGGDSANTLGLYLHIPFCRKRCKFCYFRVYTDKNSSQIERYLEALATEVEAYARTPAVAGRPLHFVYFGGGTPSYISSRHLRQLVGRLKAALPWDNAAEIAFECEPGTLTRAKLEAIRQIGVTRLSLGVENLDDGILKENGRAHVTKEIYTVVPWIEELAFDQVNMDLIAGMVGESWDSWRQTVQKTIDLNPHSVTIYQMELPFNTVYSKGVLAGEAQLGFADWQTKREWQAFAFEELAAAGYRTSSAYTAVKEGRPTRFVYRDAVWQGSDMLGTGVASFGHMSGVHMQNETQWDAYLSQVEAGQLPLKRAYNTSAEQRLVREFILQLKLGRIGTGYFKEKFGVDVLDHFAAGLDHWRERGLLAYDADQVQLSPEGLLQVDALLPSFYDEEYRNVRYT